MSQDQDSNAASENAHLTPMMRQYYDLKKQCGDAVLFFRMGDFFEIFGTDAEEVAPVLDLVLTSRERGDQTRVPFCGVPHHSARNYWLKLLKRGYKVAIADQTEDPAQAKGLVRREIIRTLTPGCAFDLEGLEPDTPNYIVAIHQDPDSRSWAALLAETSTGELRLGNLSSLADLATLRERFRPREIWLRKILLADVKAELERTPESGKVLCETLPEAPLRDRLMQKQLLGEVFGKQELASQPCGEIVGGEALVASFIGRLQELKASLGQFLSVRPMHEPGTMTLDETAIRDLELFETSRRRESEGSLFREIDRCLSPMGARLLRFFLARPLMDRDQIRARHASVARLMRLGEGELLEIRTELKGMPDLERLATRAFGGIASPSELARMMAALDKARWLAERISQRLAGKGEGDVLPALAIGLGFGRQPGRILQEALVEQPRPLGSGQGVFRPGYDSDLDRLSELARSGEQKIEEYQEQLRAQTGISSLKIKNHQTYGLLIEITRANLAKVPQEFIRRQTMVNNERFVTVELSELNEALASASEKAVEREAQLFAELMTKLSRFRSDITSTAQALASFDMLLGFAWLAMEKGWCEPRLVEDGHMELKGSRHPVVERVVGMHAFTPNDITMTPKKKHLLITGPNMAGKSTVMRQTAITAILCQVGSFVPAHTAKLPVFDRIFTRVGASDDLSRGQSTFMVEMSEAAAILRHATQNSLVILDEVGRGTSTQDGLAIATAIFKDLVLRVRCYSLFATHYHELAPLAASLGTVAVMQTEVLEEQGKILFSHRLKPGASGSSYGIEVARIAGLPASVIAAAQEVLSKPAILGKSVAIRTVEGGRGEAAPALTRFGLKLSEEETSSAPAVAALKAQHPALEKLARLDLNRLTPLQALNFVSEIQASLAIERARVLFPEESC